MGLPPNVIPADTNSFSNSLSGISSAHINSVTYNSVTDTITVTFKTPIAAGSTGNFNIILRYTSGNTPYGYQPPLYFYMDADNNTNPDASTGSWYGDTAYVKALASNNFNLGKTRVAGGAENDLTIYRITLGSSATAGLNLGSVVLIDTLPAGTQFISANAFSGSNAPVYDGLNNTITWTWPSGSLNAGYSSSVYITVKYPTPTFVINDNVCNKAFLGGTVPTLPIGVGTPQASSKNTSVCHDIVAPDPKARCLNPGISAATANWMSRHVIRGTSGNTFTNSWENNGNTELDSVFMILNIDSSVDVTALTIRPIYNVYDSITTGKIIVDYRTNLSGTTYKTGSTYNNITANQTFTPSLAGGEYITHFRVTVQGPLDLGADQTLNYNATIRTDAQGKKPSGSIVEGSTYNTSNVGDDGTIITNSSTGGYYVGATLTNYSNCNLTAEILKDLPVFNGPSKSLQNGTTHDPSDTLRYRFQLQLGGTIPAINVVVYDTLDSRLTYIHGTSVYGTSSNPNTSITPVLSGNVLIWTFDTLQPGFTYRLDFSVQLQPGTAAGSVNNRIHYNSDNAIYPAGKITSIRTATIASNAALVAKKGQNGCDPTFLYYPDVALTKEGSPVNYKITIQNLGNVAAKDLVFVDIFPFIGDHRGSQWFANTVSPVTLNDTLSTLYYTTTNDPCLNDFTPAVGIGSCNTPSWSTTPPVDITSVKAIKITRSTPLQPLDSIEMYWNMKAPNGVPAGYLMNNSVTYQVKRADNNQQLLAATPNMIGMQTSCVNTLGSIGDYTWVDENRNGLQDEAAPKGLNGVKVYLYGAGANNAIGGGDDVILDSTVTGNHFNGNPGFYLFPDLNSGYYYVKFQTEYNSHVITPVLNQADSTNGNNDADSLSGNSGLVYIDENGAGQAKHNTTIDAGYYPYGTLGNYVWLDDNLDGSQNEAANKGVNGVTVYLWRDFGGTYHLIDSMLTANKNGEPGYYLFNIYESGNYKVQFPVNLGTKTLSTQTATAGTDGNSDASQVDGFSPVIVMNVFGSGVAKHNPTIDAGYGCYITKPTISAAGGLCGSGYANLVSTPATSIGSTYQWYKNNVAIVGATAQSYLTSQNGLYKIVISDTSGCQAEDTVSIAVSPSANVGFFINDTNQCLSSQGFQFVNTSGGAGYAGSIWDTTQVVGTPVTLDTLAIEVGVKFRTSSIGVVKGLRFYKLASANGPFVGKLYTSAGTVLATATFTTSSSGWQQVTFSSPILIDSGVTYVASYYAPNGNYAKDEFYFTASGVTSGDLTFLQTGVDGGNGVYKYGTGGGFPTSSSNDANYWVDVIFESTQGLSYLWSFGDGNTSTAFMPTHNYATNGYKSVKLVVTNSYGCKDSLTKLINVSGPNSNFSYTQDCEGNVSFKNLSTNATDFIWQFGAKTFECDITNADAFNKFLPGTHRVLLISRNLGECNDTMEQNITVYPTPVAVMSENPVYCTKEVNFANYSANAVNYAWNFGDGSSTTDTSTVFEPSYTYPADGNYAVRLLAYNPAGCPDTLVKNITVNSTGTMPTAAISATNISGACVAKYQFNSTSSNAASHKWIFPDNSVMTGSPANKSFPFAGNYDVKLVAQSADGCLDTATVSINVPTNTGGAIASFTVNSDKQCLNGNSFNFLNASTFAGTGYNYAYQWNFGDGTTNNVNTYVYNKKYTTPGVYTVRLIALGTNGCRDTAYQTIEVLPSPVLSFTANPYCSTSAEIINNSTGAISYLWDFGNGGFAENNSDTFTYKYPEENWYFITLTGIGANGCSATVDQGILTTRVSSPIVNFTYDTSWCNNGIRFINTTTGASHVEWNFGDGTAFSTDFSPIHAYNPAGYYTVTLTASNGPFCSASAQLIVGAPLGWNIPYPKAMFAVDVEACTNKITATDTSLNNGGGVQWFFDGIAKGTGNTMVIDTPSYGYHTIMLVVKNQSCYDTLKKLVNIQAPPVSSFTYQMSNCSKSVLFETSAPEGVNFTWDFNDAGAVADTATGMMASHNFSNNGNYVVAHTVYNASGCGVTSYDTLNVNNAVNNPGQADFYYDYNVCADCCCDNKIQFHNTSSGSANTYLWSFGDGFTSTQPEPYKGYGASGYYNVNLTAFHAPGCFTTASKLIYVSEDATGPSAAFKVNQRTQCQLSNSFHFTNYSQYMGVGYILKYYWNFGDGTIDSSSTNVYNKKYTAAGTYTVRLVAKGIKNCYDTMLLEVVVDPCILGNVVNAGNNDGLNSNLTFLKNNATSVNTITQESTWALYPNPNAGVFTVNTNMDASNMSLKIVDLLGREVEALVVRNGNTFAINANSIVSGSYIVTVFEGETQVQRLKFVVNK